MAETMPPGSFVPGAHARGVITERTSGLRERTEQFKNIERHVSGAPPRG
jgi:hypothetical protein